MIAGPWGPFRLGKDAWARKIELRTLRTAAKLLCGPRASELAYRLLLAEITPEDADLLRDAEAEFGRLGSYDQRRILTSFSNVNFEKPAA